MKSFKKVAILVNLFTMFAITPIVATFAFFVFYAGAHETWLKVMLGVSAIINLLFIINGLLDILDIIRNNLQTKVVEITHNNGLGNLDYKGYNKEEVATTPQSHIVGMHELGEFKLSSSHNLVVGKEYKIHYTKRSKIIVKYQQVGSTM